MIDQVDVRLKAWVETVLGTISIALTSPREIPTDPVVYLYLMRITPALAPPTAKRLPRQVLLHYLITARAPDPEQAHRLLGDLVLAALDGENADFELDFEPLPVETWIALGVEPLPAFIIKIPLSRERPQREIPLVRVPMVIRAASITSLQGTVLGPQDQPLQGALVELASVRQYQRTDAQGNFRFASVPTDPQTQQLRVSAKGHELEVSVELSAEPIVIHLFDERPL